MKIKLATLLILVATPAFAQTIQDINNAARQSEQIQREQELRRQDQILRDEMSAQPPTRLEAPAPVLPAAPASPVCRDIQNIVLKDAKLLSSSEQKALVQPYEGQCLRVDDIQMLLSDITRVYIDKGYATSRAYIPAQDLTTGTLQILIIEGRVSKIEINDGQCKKSLNAKGAFPDVVGEPLNLTDFEQGIDQLNRLQSNRVTMDIKPGDKPGDSIVVINNTPGKRWQVNTGIDNYGVRSTGRVQTSATASIDNPLGGNEFFSYTRRESVPFRDDEKSSQSNNLYFSVPYGYTTFSAGVFDSDYNSTLNTPGGVALSLSGTSLSIFGKVDYTAYRHKNDKLNLSSTVTYKNNKNYLANQILDVSSRRLSVVDVDADYSTIAGGGFLQLGMGISKGIKIFNALDDQPGLPQGQVPHAQFTKLRATAAYTKPFKVQYQQMAYSTQVSAQTSDRAMYGSEQLSIGSIYTVRGFYDESLANDKGVYMRNDLSMSLPIGDIVPCVPATLRPYLALDAGAVSGHTNSTAHGALIGSAAGISLISGPVFFDVYVSRALLKPSSIDDEGFMTFARLSVTF